MLILVNVKMQIDKKKEHARLHNKHEMHANT